MIRQDEGFAPDGRGIRERAKEGGAAPVRRRMRLAGRVGLAAVSGYHGLQVVEHRLAQLVERAVVASVGGDVLHEDEVALGRGGILRRVEGQVAPCQVSVGRPRLPA